MARLTCGESFSEHSGHIARDAKHNFENAQFVAANKEMTHAHSARQPAFDRGPDEMGGKESERDRHIDFSDAAALALGNAFDGDACILDNLLKPTAPARNRGDQGGAGLRADRTRAFGLNVVRQENFAPPFRWWLVAGQRVFSSAQDWARRARSS